VENEKSKPSEEEYIVNLGKKDGVFTYDSQWLIFVLHTLDTTGIWLRLQNQLDILEYQKTLQSLTVKEIEEFLLDNPNIAFETEMFEELMPNYFFFKLKNQVYCYTTGKKGKDKVRIYARFYFDLEDIIKN